MRCLMAQILNLRPGKSAWHVRRLRKMALPHLAGNIIGSHFFRPHVVFAQQMRGVGIIETVHFR
jgi:hypothetical protein